jgi:hypothetical protein
VENQQKIRRSLRELKREEKGIFSGKKIPEFSGIYFPWD